MGSCGYDTGSTGSKNENKQVGLQQTKKVCTAKRAAEGKGTCGTGENTGNHMSDKGFISETERNSSVSTVKTRITPFKQWAKDLSRHFSKKIHT